VNTVRVAAIQLVSRSEVEKNLRSAEYWIRKAAAQGAQLIVLPENFYLLESRRLLLIGEQEITATGRVRTALSVLARENNVWLIAGSLPCACRPDGSAISDKVRSVCWVFNNHGETVARYDKIHLFDVDIEDDYGSYRESALVEAGDDVTDVDTPFGRVGLSICYDLRFPELYRKLAVGGADLVVIPAAFTFKTGEAHWEILLRARAIENQVFVIAANQGGRHSDRRETFGHSMIIDPWGVVLAVQEAMGEGLVIADLDLQKQKQIRKTMPVLSHRRL
jgi:predicted amidohydrolase